MVAQNWLNLELFGEFRAVEMGEPALAGEIEDQVVGLRRAAPEQRAGVGPADGRAGACGWCQPAPECGLRPKLAIARIRMDAGFAARQMRQAVDKLLDVGGASRFAESSPAQRIWRDLGTATRHPVSSPRSTANGYASRLLLGINGK